MKNLINRNNLVACIIFATSAIAVLSSCKKEKKADPDSPAYLILQSEKLSIPDAVALPSNLPGGNTRVATFYANGVQKYKAQEVAGSNPLRYEWVFVAPQADLYDINNNKVGTHSAGPDWQLSATDSMFGQAFTPPRTATSKDSNGIDWLLLMPKTGKTPTGIFAQVSYVQRIATKGGKAPAIPPVAATDVANVPYTAVYRFTKKNE
ncbi:MAG: DUF3455 domain-containing protein [Flavisolibacter sp.]